MAAVADKRSKPGWSGQPPGRKASEERDEKDGELHEDKIR
jgi:hypothetical protein